MIRVPAHVAGIAPYVPGKPIEELERELGIEGAVKLASNENPVGPSPLALDAARRALEDISRYPDGGGYHLKCAIAARHDLAPENILLGNGSNELIEIAARAFLITGDEGELASPSFVVYDSAVRAAGGRSVIVPLRDFRHDLPAMADRITPATRIVFIANPNNPTGTIVKKTEVEEFLGRVPDGCLVIFDEAYFEYVDDPEFPDTLAYLRDGRDVLILRTFSKAYGLAGLRVGYAIGPARVIEAMNRIRPPFNVNSVAQAAAVAAWDDTAHLERVIRVNEEGKKYLEAELGRLGQSFPATQANFFYLPTSGTGMDAGTIYEKMLRRGVIVRPMGPGAIRVTIGLPGENRRFIEVFKMVVGSVAG